MLILQDSQLPTHGVPQDQCETQMDTTHFTEKTKSPGLLSQMPSDMVKIGLSSTLGSGLAGSKNTRNRNISVTDNQLKSRNNLSKGMASAEVITVGNDPEGVYEEEHTASKAEVRSNRNG